MTLHFDFFRTEYTSIFSSLAEYLVTMETQLGKAADTEWASNLEYLSKLTDPEEWDQESSTAFFEHSYTYEYMFPRFYRYSFIVLVFLIFETQMTGLCDQLQSRRKLSLRLKDVRASGTVPTFRTYLSKVVGITGWDESHWQRMDDLSKVRNCIVHALGKVDVSNDGKQLQAILKRTRSLSVSDGTSGPIGFLLVKPEYCTQIIADVESFLDEICDLGGFGPKHITLVTDPTDTQ